MGKKTVSDLKSSFAFLHKNNYFVLKLGVSVLLVGLAFRLLSNRSSDWPPSSDAPFISTSQSSATPNVSESSREDTDRIDSLEDTEQITPKEYHVESIHSNEKCDYFTGDWVPYEGEPLYTNNTCRIIEDHQNCMKNGRPDTGYLYWRWKPRDCELPRVDPGRFLEMMRDKTWAFIGDSISRNQVQSFLCVLSTVENAVEVYHDENYKSRRWVFPSHNFTVSVLWSPLLAQASIFEDVNGVSTSEIELHLDLLDKNWTDHYNSFNYMVFSSGKWFTKTAIYFENNTAIGCHKCYTRNLTEVGFDFAQRKVTRNVLDYIIKSNHKGTIFYRTSVPDHFEGGEWFSGGTCDRTSPAKEGEFEPNELDKIVRNIEVEELEKLAVDAIGSGVDIKVFDVFPLSLMRPDGHPGPYRFFQPFAKETNTTVIRDCLHWCLPGPIDSWNDILMGMLVNG